MVGKLHIKLQYEWAEKLKCPPYNCEFVELEHMLQIGITPLFVDVYGKNKKGNEYIVEIGNIQKEKITLLQEFYKDKFIHVLFPYKTSIPQKTEFSQQISIRIPHNIMRNIIEYSKCHNRNNITQTILFFICNGATNLEMIEETKKFLDEQEIMMGNLFKTELENKTKNIDLKNPYIRTLERDNFICRKCGSSVGINNPTKLPINLENETAAGFGIESYITLCEKCKNELQTYILSKLSLEQFIEWYYNRNKE